MRIVISTLLVSCMLSFAFHCNAQNLSVLRVGDGSTTLSNSAAPVFIDYYNSVGTAVGVSTALPTVTSGPNHAITISGTATTEGMLTQSVDGRYLVLAGYDAASGTASVATTAGINRTIATVDASGTVNTSTGITAGGAYITNNIRGAATVDGTSFWCSGLGTSTGGTYYLPAGAFTSSPVQVSADVQNTRAVNIFNSQLYASSASGNYHGINSVGVGEPTTSGQTTTNLSGAHNSASTSAYAFWFLDMNPDTAGVDVLYVCDDRTTSPDGGLYKYSLVGGVWTYNGNVTSNTGLRGLVVQKNCTGNTVNIYVSSETAVYSLTDTTGYNQTISGSFSQIITAAANTRIRGIAFKPGSGPAVLSAGVNAVTNVSCYGGQNGAIDVATQGGFAPLTYAWNTGDTSQDIGVLSAGTYTVTVTDSHGCTDTAAAIVVQPAAALIVSAAVNNISCFGAGDGVITPTATGGTPVYAYSTTGSDGSAPGAFSITVTDANGCTASTSGTVTEPTALTGNSAHVNVLCFGQANGSTVVHASGGTLPYSYSWDTASTDSSLTGLSAGTYNFTITDGHGCSVTGSSVVTSPPALTLSSLSTNAHCYGLADGTVSLTISGGTPAYSSVLTDTANHSQFSSTGTFSGLVAGNYMAIATDNNGCTVVDSVSVGQPDSLSLSGSVVNATSHGGSDGSITLTVAGGVSNYTYNWSNSLSTQNINNLSAGNYCITVSDANACSITNCFTVSEPSSIEETAGLQQLIIYKAGETIFVDAQLNQESNYSVTLLGLDGRIVYATAPKAGAEIHQQIPVISLASACYLLKITTNEGAVTRKIVLTR